MAPSALTCAGDGSTPYLQKSRLDELERLVLDPCGFRKHRGRTEPSPLCVAGQSRSHGPGPCSQQGGSEHYEWRRCVAYRTFWPEVRRGAGRSLPELDQPAEPVTNQLRHPGQRSRAVIPPQSLLLPESARARSRHRRTENSPRSGRIQARYQVPLVSVNQARERARSIRTGRPRLPPCPVRGRAQTEPE